MNFQYKMFKNIKNLLKIACPEYSRGVNFKLKIILHFKLFYSIIARMANKVQKKAKTEKEEKLQIEIVRRMLNLATAGFGLVAALAWNNLIQEVVKKYIAVWIPDFGPVFTLLMYAMIVTILAVLITFHLTKLLRRLESAAGVQSED